MAAPERFDALVLGSGQGGKLLAWDLARSGRRTAVVERRWIGGSCPNINCMPSKNEIWSAHVAYVARHGAEFGTMTDRVAVDMMKVRQRKRDMVDRQVDAHLRAYKESGAELIMGTGHFIAPKTLEVRLNGGGGRVSSTQTRSSSTSARTGQFPTFPAWKRPARSPASKRWNSTTCRHTWSCSAEAMSVSNSARRIVASAVA